MTTNPTTYPRQAGTISIKTQGQRVAVSKKASGVEKAGH